MGEEKTRESAISFLKSMECGKTEPTAFAYQVAHYVIDHPEKAAELANHHYQDYLGYKQKYMARAVVEGKHRNMLSLRDRGLTDLPVTLSLGKKY